MASYDYEYYSCPKCKDKLTTKVCRVCNTKTKGQGKVSMRFRLVENHRKVNKRTGWYATQKEAKAEYLHIMSSTPKVDMRTRDGESYIFSEMLKKHLAENALNTAPSTQYEKERVFAKHILPIFKSKDIRKITKSQLIDWQTALYCYKHNNKPIAHKTASKIRGFLFTFFEWAFYKYEIPNLLRGVKKPVNTERKEPKQFLELTEFYALDNISKDDTLWNTIFCFMMHSGCRVGEIQAFSETDYDNKSITVNKTISNDRKGRPYVRPIPKNKKTYTKPLDDFICEKLDKYLSWKRNNGVASGFLFGGDNFIDIHHFSRKLKHYLAKIGVQKKITPHSFRHGYVSMLVDMGCTTKIVAEMIGDTEEIVMNTYSHIYSAKKQETISLFNDYLRQNLGTNTGTKTNQTIINCGK